MTETAAESGTPVSIAAEIPAPVEAVQPQAVDLATIPDDILLKDPRFNTLVGRHAQRLAERERARIESEASSRAVRDQEQAMMQLAQSNPFEFTQKWLGEKAEEVARREFSELEAKTQREVLDKLGEAYGQIPEWKELTQDEFADVAARTANLSGADLIAAFNVAAFDKIADRRARKRVDSEMQTRLKTEREAWERESAAARLKGESVPSLLPGTEGARFDISQLSDEEFNKWYVANWLR